MEDGFIAAQLGEPSEMSFEDGEVIFGYSRYNVVFGDSKAFGVAAFNANGGLLNFASEGDSVRFARDLFRVVPGSHLLIEQGQDREAGVYYVEWGLR